MCRKWGKNVVFLDKGTNGTLKLFMGSRKIQMWLWGLGRLGAALAGERLSDWAFAAGQAAHGC